MDVEHRDGHKGLGIGCQCHLELLITHAVPLLAGGVTVTNTMSAAAMSTAHQHCLEPAAAVTAAAVAAAAVATAVAAALRHVRRVLRAVIFLSLQHPRQLVVVRLLHLLLLVRGGHGHPPLASRLLRLTALHWVVPASHVGWHAHGARACFCGRCVL